MYRDKPVTRRMLANHLGISIDNVKQVVSKQLFLVYDQESQVTSLYSYYTKVGYRNSLISGTWRLTTTKYSVTTSKQLSQFAHGRAVEWVSELP